MTIIGYKAKMPVQKTVKTLANISPFFAHDLNDIYNETTNPGGYWAWSQKPAELTQKSDGWAHVELNSTTMPTYVPIPIKWIPSQWDLENDLTMLVEIQGYSVVTSGACSLGFLSSTSGNVAAISGRTGIDITGDGTHRIVMQHASGNGTCLVYGQLTLAPGASVEFDIRLSLYQHAYSGEFQEYQEV